MITRSASRSIPLFMCLATTTLIVAAHAANTPTAVPPTPCPEGIILDNGSCLDCKPGLIFRGAEGSDTGSDGMGGPGFPGGAGCASGSCGGGGGAPLFTAEVGVGTEGAAGFSLALGGPARPGGLSGGVLLFQVKVLTGGGLPLSALQYSLAPYKPIVRPSGRVMHADLWNERHDYSAGTDFVFRAENPRDRTTVRMVGAQGGWVTNAPVAIDVGGASGDVLRCRVGDTNDPAVAALPEYSLFNNKLGIWRSPADEGISVVRDAGGNLSEIVTPACYTRIMPGETGFDVVVYPPAGRTSSVPPIVTYRAQAESGQDSYSGDQAMSFLEMRPGYTNLTTFSNNPLNKRWMMVRGGGERHFLRLVTSTSPDETVRAQIHDRAGKLLAQREDVRRQFAWGAEIVSTTMGTGSCAVVTVNDFYTTSTEVGRYARLKSVTRSDGTWAKYDYDAQGRTIRETRSWKNMPYSAGASTTNADDTVYDYGPDPLNPWPLVTTECIDGKVVRRTYHSNTKHAQQSFMAPAGYTVELRTERAASPGAGQGASSNPVSAEYYHGVESDAASRGALKARVREDGTMESYEYAGGTFNGTNDPCFTAGAGSFHRTIMTRGTVQSPGGLAFRTTQEITIRDPRGQVVFEETRVHTGSGYQRMGWSLHAYDAAGHRVRSDFADGTHREWDYTPGRLAASTDRDGTVVTYNYDVFGRLVDTTHTGVAAYGNYPGQPDRTTTRLYDAMHRPVADIQSAGELSLASLREYDILGRLVGQTDAQGLATQYGYVSNGLVRTVTLPGGLVRTTVNFSDGRPFSVSENGVLKAVHDYGVNSEGSQWSKACSGPAGSNSPAWSKTTTDFLGRPVREEKPGFGGVTNTTVYSYNTKGQLQQKSEVYGLKSTVSLSEYDSLGEQIRSGLDVNTNGVLDLAGPDRVTESIRHYIQSDGDWYDETLALVYPDATGAPVTNAISRSSAGGLSCGCAVLKSESVDSLGNLTESTTVMDPAHRLVTKSVLSPFSTNAAADITYNGLPVESTTATGVRTIYAHDALGRQTSALSPSGAGTPPSRKVGTFTAYSDLGQVAWTMDTASNKTFYLYDSAGRRVQATDALSNSTFTAYDPENHVLATWGATYPVAYDYDAYGRMTAMCTLRDSALAISNYSSFITHTSSFDRTRWVYDESTGLLTNKLYADGHGPSYTYTPDGKLATRTWARGVVTTYNYDNLGQLTNISYSDSTPAVSFTYDRLGRQATVTDGTGTRTFTYNDAMQLAAETNAMGVLCYAFDSFGRPSGFTAGDNYSVSYGYNSIGRFASVSSLINQQSTTNNFLYTYLPGSDLVQGYTNNAGFSTLRAFEPNRNLIASITNSFGGAQLRRFDYTNDELGRRNQRADFDLSSSVSNFFAYNVRSELEDAGMGTNSFSYRYDPIGNRRSSAISNQISEITTYEANSLNQYSAISNQQAQIAPTYDLDGNMTSYKDWTFAWDAENRLVMASNATTVLAFTYDYMSRRVSKTTQQLNNPTTQYFFKYQGWAMFEENTSSATNLYVYGLDLSGSQQGAGTIGGILALTTQQPDNSTTAFYCYDANGNVTDLVAPDGSSAAHYEYDPYGNTLVKSGPLVDVNPFRFSTKYLDQETGFYYYGHRYYQPESGRWLSRDPIGEGIRRIKKRHSMIPKYDLSRVSLNLYAFVRGNTVNLVDPLGLRDWGILGGRCCNDSGRNPEWALVGAGTWKSLAPGECTGLCEDCDGMTCKGGFYYVSNLERGTCTSGPDDDTARRRRWPGGDDARSPGDRGSHEGNTPPGYEYDTE